MRQTYAESKNTVKYPNFGAVMSFRWSDLLVAADFHRAILIRRTLSIRLSSRYPLSINTALKKRLRVNEGKQVQE
jgi:hypothetical protein